MKELKARRIEGNNKAWATEQMYVKSHGITYEWENLLLSSSTLCVYMCGGGGKQSNQNPITYTFTGIYSYKIK